MSLRNSTHIFSPPTFNVLAKFTDLNVTVRFVASLLYQGLIGHYRTFIGNSDCFGSFPVEGVLLSGKGISGLFHVSLFVFSKYQLHCLVLRLYHLVR